MSAFGYKPRVGDRVKVTCEGTVIDRGPGDWDDEFRIQLGNEYGERMFRLENVKVERIVPPPPPEPDHAALVIDCSGEVWSWGGKTWDAVNLDGGGESWKWPVLVEKYGPVRVFLEAS